MAQLIDQTQYQELARDLRMIVEESKQAVRVSVNFHMVKMYWQIGRRIIREDLIASAGYGDSIIDQLSQELNIAPRTIRYAIDFAELYPVLPQGENLSWSHYRELTHIHDDEARTWYEKKAIKSQMKVRDLVDRIRGNEFYKSQRKTKKPEPELSPIERPTDPSYIYKFEVERVIDGDTLLGRMDLGFEVWKDQRLRLAHIDAKSIDTPQGQKAFDHVRRQLAMNPNVTIKTTKTDIYGRYIADVFYTHEDWSRGKIFTDGQYLNEELIDLGYAVRAY